MRREKVQEAGQGSRSWQRLRRILPRLVLALIFTVLLIEGGARVILALSMGNSGLLLYPATGKLAVNHVVAHAVSESITDTDHPPSGPVTYSVGGRALHVIKINKTGHRGRALSSPRKARYRVVAMGGSTTFSPECPDGTTYPEQLERLWNQREGAGTVEVINMGENGLSTSGVVDLFQTKVAPARPDLVTVSSAFNGAQFPLLLDLRPGRAPWYRRLLWKRSAFYTAMLHGLMSRENHRFDLDQVIQRYRRYLLTLVSHARQRRIKVLFITQPLVDGARLDRAVLAGRVPASEFDQLSKNFSESEAQQDALNEAMIQVARELKVALVDPRPAMLAHPRPSEYFWIALHLTPEGSKAFAQQIVQQVQDRYHGLKGLLEY